MPINSQRQYFGAPGAQIHARISGKGRSVLFLPPAPHTGAYFDQLAPHLEGIQMLAVDYPGYGGSDRIDQPSIARYADALVQHIPEDTTLVGFHTGNLVACEIAKRTQIAGIVMIDVPFFDEETRQSYAAKLPEAGVPKSIDADFAKTVTHRHAGVDVDRAFHLWTEGLRSGAFRSDAFRAAFNYDVEQGMSDLPCPVAMIATQSSLLDLTRNAAQLIGVSLTERIDVVSPVFETFPKEMSAEILKAIRGLND